ASRVAGDPDARGIYAELARIRAHPPHARGDVLRRRRMLVVRSLAKVERHDDEPARGQPSTVMQTDGTITTRPRPAVHVNERGERRGRRAPWAIDAREHVVAVEAGKRDVLLLDLVRCRLIEADVHT